jgi:hypothetical protein
MGPELELFVIGHSKRMINIFIFQSWWFGGFKESNALTEMKNVLSLWDNIQVTGKVLI